MQKLKYILEEQAVAIHCTSIIGELQSVLNCPEGAD